MASVHEGASYLPPVAGLQRSAAAAEPRKAPDFVRLLRQEHRRGPPLSPAPCVTRADLKGKRTRGSSLSTREATAKACCLFKRTAAAGSSAPESKGVLDGRTERPGSNVDWFDEPAVKLLPGHVLQDFRRMKQKFSLSRSLSVSHTHRGNGSGDDTRQLALSYVEI